MLVPFSCTAKKQTKLLISNSAIKTNTGINPDNQGGGDWEIEPETKILSCFNPVVDHHRDPEE